jgi:PQQ-dependent catabolism-associated beta-propeller protein
VTSRRTCTRCASARRAHGGALFVVLAVARALPAPARADDAPLAYVSNERDGTVSVIDTGSERVIASIDVGGRPRGIRAGRGGERVYVAVSRQSWVREPFPEAIVVLDARTRTIARRIQVGADPEQFVVTPDERRLVTANEESAAASLTDLATDATIATLPVGIEPEGVGVSPDGRWAYVTAETTNTVSVIDVARAAVVHAFLVDARPRDAVFAADGKRAYVSAEIAGTVAVVDPAVHEVIDVIAMPDGQSAVGLAVSPDGATLYVANGHANRVSVIDTATARLVQQIPVGYRPWGVALTADGRKLYTADGVSNQVSVVDTTRRRVVATIPVGDRPWGIAIAPRPGPR